MLKLEDVSFYNTLYTVDSPYVGWFLIKNRFPSIEPGMIEALG